MYGTGAYPYPQKKHSHLDKMNFAVPIDIQDSRVEYCRKGQTWTSNLLDARTAFWFRGPVFALQGWVSARALSGKRKNRVSGRPSASRRGDLCASLTEISPKPGPEAQKAAPRNQKTVPGTPLGALSSWSPEGSLACGRWPAVAWGHRHCSTRPVNADSRFSGLGTGG